MRPDHDATSHTAGGRRRYEHTADAAAQRFRAAIGRRNDVQRSSLPLFECPPDQRRRLRSYLPVRPESRRRLR